MSEVRLRVAICGGGIGGLCLAVALSRYSDIKIDIYEAAERFKEIGAGVMIWGRTWHILSQLGLADEFSKVAHAPPDGSQGIGFDFRRSDSLQEGYRFHLFELPYGCIRFHRAHFLDVFVDHLPEGVAHFGKRLTSFTETTEGSVSLLFDDWTTASCDVLVGCDGIKSTVRSQIFKEKAAAGQPHLSKFIEPTWSGTIAYRGLIPVERLKDGKKVHRTVDSPMMYCGKSKHVVSYSISRGSVVNVVTLASRMEDRGKPFDGPWVTDCSQSELLECYPKWEPEVEQLLRCIENPTKWALHELRPLPFWVTNCVALLGDAAHAMTPHQGAGAGQAIEDAYVLASLLGRPSVSKANISRALKAYELVRLPLANHVLDGSRRACHLYEFDSEHGDNYPTLAPAIQHQWDWLSKTTPESAIASACRSMEEDSLTVASKL